MRVCVTGASGFVGTALVRQFARRGDRVVAVARAWHGAAPCDGNVEWVHCDLSESAPPLESMGTFDAIVHLAGRAHVLTDRDADPLSAFRRVNTEATERLAGTAARAGIPRFVFASSIGVHGSALSGPMPIDESSAIDPLEPYAISKWEAEQSLRRVERDTGMTVTVVRPSLVAGPHAPGNLDRLARFVRRGVPLPVPRVDNARSFVELDHLAELLLRCAQCRDAAGQSFVAAEPEWPSTRQIIQWIGEGAGLRARCIALPDAFLGRLARLLGQGRLYDKLYGDLRVDSARARQCLNWHPRRPLAEAFRDVGRAVVDATG